MRDNSGGESVSENHGSATSASIGGLRLRMGFRINKQFVQSQPATD
jgi:hypothetical protein